MPRADVFSVAERAFIVRQYTEAEWSTRRIAREMGRSFSGVHHVLVAAGVEMRPRGVASGAKALMVQPYETMVLREALEAYVAAGRPSLRKKDAAAAMLARLSGKW